MLKIIQAFLIAVLTQILAVFVFSILALVFNVDVYYAISSIKLSFLVQNVLIIIVYLIITILINQYFKSAYKLNYKPSILGLSLLIAYLVIFYLSNQNEEVFKFFLLIHYPIGSYFRTIPYSSLDLIIKMSLIISILSSMFGVSISQKISRFRNKKTKKKLNSLSKKQ